jgi:hypothetical protein
VTTPQRSGHLVDRCGVHGLTRRKRDSGAVAVEFALVVPLLVLFLFGTVVAGSIFVDNLKLQAAAREGARAGAVIPARACSTAMNALNVTGATCRVDASCPGNSSAIRLESTEKVTLPLLGERTVNLRATARFSCLV